MLRLTPFIFLLSLTACVETTGSVAPTTSATSQQTAFLGNWETVQSCSDGTNQTNILKIRSATPTEVLGTTNVGTDGVGNIIGGTVNGRDVTFTNTFVAFWDRGQTYTEVWTGKMSADGTSVSGRYSSNSPNNPGDCTFAGPKI